MNLSASLLSIAFLAMSLLGCTKSKVLTSHVDQPLTVGTMDTHSHGCQYHGTASHFKFDHRYERPTRAAQEKFEMICNAVGVDSRDYNLYMVRGINNAFATIGDYGQKIIAYDPRFMNEVDYSNNGYAAVSILAHELGHHEMGMNTRRGQHGDELAADYFSGYVLNLLGSILSDAQGAMRTISPWYASSSHPGLPDRLAKIKQGWQDAEQGREMRY